MSHRAHSRARRRSRLSGLAVAVALSAAIVLGLAVIDAAAEPVATVAGPPASSPAAGTGAEVEAGGLGPAAAGARAATRPAGSRPLTDPAAEARVRRSWWEPRPENRAENRTVPTRSQLERFRAQSNLASEVAAVTGGFEGTTDEILQWAAHKWGVDEDVARAVAVVESRWRMEEVGDNGHSHGLMQVKKSAHLGTYPMSARSTAFNADIWGAVFRHYFDGRATWLSTVSGNGGEYRRGDFWGAIGAWYSGRWHDDAARAYVEEVRRHVRDRTWERAGF